ncbi:MAG: hypothetical protein K2X27_00520 [Candidatus Obscuribacterales bacterium]|nr:hypothetical protein [Candidatus Obscuribacterales bacterium]
MKPSKSKPAQLKLLDGQRLIDSSLPLRHITCAGDLKAVHRVLHAHEGGQICRKPLIVLPGTGRKTFKLPSVQEIISVCVQYINKAAVEKRAREEAAARNSGGRRKTKEDDDSVNEPSIKAILESGSMASIVPLVHSGGIAPVNTHGGTLYLAAGGLAECMYDGRFEEHLAPIFDPPQGTEDWAAKHMPAKFQETVESLRYHWQEIYKLFVGDEDISRSHVSGALPSVMHAVSANFPGAGEDEVIAAAVSVICKALAQIMSVLQMWDSSFVQQRDGKYTELMYMTYTLEQCFKLMTQGVETMVMHVGDVYMPRYSGGGPATIPGARGPLHAHLIEVPFNMRRSLITNMPVFTHEFRHDVYADVPNLPVQMAQAVLESIDRHAPYDFSSETIKLGGQEVPTLDLIKQIYIQTLSETDADIAGGVLLTGPAFGFSLISVFSALNSMGENILNADVLLRHGSRYAVDLDNGEPELVFAVHMPDYPRAYVVAAALDNLGFEAAAKELRIIADQAAGDEKPTMVTWTNGDPSDKRFKFKIEVPFADLIKVAPAVVDGIINSKLECLVGRSMKDLVFFDAHKQTKVEELAKLLEQGKWEFPEGFGDVFANYVAAAAITAYWNLCKAGARPRSALAQVEACARKMLDEVVKRGASSVPTTPPAPQDPAPTTPKA